MSKPHRCPICDGSGVYLQPGETAWTAVPTRASHPCHGCAGTGIIWSFELKVTDSELGCCPWWQRPSNHGT